MHAIQVLQRHPARTFNSSAASLFFVPIFEYSSYYIGDCNGTTHRTRMEVAEKALRSAAPYQRNGGVDHFFATSAWSISGSALSLCGLPAPPPDPRWHSSSACMVCVARTSVAAARMQPLATLLSCGSAGRYKHFPSNGGARTSSVAACTFEIPYQANLVSGRLYRPPDDPRALPRTTLLHFAGALDVCCTGRNIRCAIAPLCAL